MNILSLYACLYLCKREREREEEREQSTLEQVRFLTCMKKNVVLGCPFVARSLTLSILFRLNILGVKLCMAAIHVSRLGNL